MNTLPRPEPVAPWLRLPWSPAVSRSVLGVSFLLAPCLPWIWWLPSPPVVSRLVVSGIVLVVSLMLAPGLPCLPWLPSWLLWSPVVSRIVLVVSLVLAPCLPWLPLLPSPPVVSRGLPSRFFTFWFFLYCELLVSRGSRGSWCLTSPPVISRGLPSPPVVSRGLPWSPAPWSPVLFWLFLYCWLLVSRGSRGSRHLP